MEHRPLMYPPKRGVHAIENRSCNCRPGTLPVEQEEGNNLAGQLENADSYVALHHRLLHPPDGGIQLNSVEKGKGSATRPREDYRYTE